MAYNWSNFPQHDRLNHAQAISEQMTKVRNTFSAAKSKEAALRLQTMLNSFYSPANTAGLFGQSTVTQQKIQQAMDIILSNLHGKSFSTNLQNLGISQDGGWKQNLITSPVQLQNLRTQIEMLYAEIAGATGFSEAKVDKLMLTYSKLMSQLNSQGGANTLIIPDNNLILQYNNLVTQVFGNGAISALGTNSEMLTSLFNANLDDYSTKTVDDIVKDMSSRMVGGASHGSTPSIATTGMKQNRVNTFLSQNKRWNHKDEFGNLLWQQVTPDKVDVILTLPDESPYYISNKAYVKGAQANINFVDSTRLASLLSSSLVTEPFARAYLRFAGWKWGVGRSRFPYEEKSLYSLAQKLAALLAISGEGYQNSTAEILAVQSATGQFVCYSIQDIAERFLSDTTDTVVKSINAQGLPQKEELRPRPITNHFLDVIVSVNIQNLQNLMGY